MRDVRRFNYICALLELLLGGQKLTHLPGAAQKLLLSMLEQLADQGERAKTVQFYNTLLVITNNLGGS